MMLYQPNFSQIQLVRELTLIAEKDKDHDFVEHWPEWLDRIILYGELEAKSRTAVQNVMSTYEEEMTQGICIIKSI